MKEITYEMGNSRQQLDPSNFHIASCEFVHKVGTILLLALGK
jgi:hypothetical protein